MANRKLSIITICYNEPDLNKTCESIVNQTWQDFEWIVVDGGSNKETLEIIKKYKSRINKFVSEPDNGIYNACNKGIRLAEGEYIHFLNAGDAYYSNDVLEKVFGKNAYDEDILYGKQLEVVGGNYSKSRISRLSESVDKEYFINNNIHTAAMFIKTELFRLYGLYDENYKIAADREKWIVFAENNARFRFVDVIVAYFDKGGVSSSDKYRALHKKEVANILKRHYTPEEIENSKDSIVKKLSFWKNIFSILNTGGMRYKVVTILGFHIFLRRKSFEE